MTTKAITLPEKVKPTTTESVTFTDGMVVTAEDLEAAMHYPASMLHTALRAYFGCGVVCGLALESEIGTVDEPRWILCVAEGVAFDCNGYPLELCGPVNLDLSPDACSVGYPSDGLDVHIAIRRTTHGEAGANACSCDTSGPERHCSRTRDHVLVKAFLKSDLDALKPGLCKRSDRSTVDVDPKKGNETGQTADRQDEDEQTRRQRLCKCLTACSDCVCTDESWVYLGSVTMKKDTGVAVVDVGERKYVKPIECVCAGIDERLRDLEDKVNSYQTK